jgi:hypothetical protein
MRSHHTLQLVVIAAVLVGATSSADAQDKSKAKGPPAKAVVKTTKAKPVVKTADGNVVLVTPAKKVPPGLAKKPGQMPPGQYKKYTSHDGAITLRDILVGRGYVVTQIVPVGTSQYVYYRTATGAVTRAYITPGVERLTFTNVPGYILNAVLAKLY